MLDLRSLTIQEMEELVLSLGEKKFRAKQVFSWVHKGVRSLREMRNLPKTFLDELSEHAEIVSPEIVRHQKSNADGTEKFLFAMRSSLIESVLMRYNYGNTVCVSSQAGCRMGCSFCASGIKGLERGLTAGEIVSQVMEIEKAAGDNVSRVVFMGTGEPFDNYDEVAKAIRILNDKNGKNMGMRNITASTCGLVPGIDRFGDDFPEVNLAISLHSALSGLREELMPVAKSYPLEVLMDATDRYVKKTNRRVSYEYALIKGKNDTDDALKALTGLLRGRLAHVNLIPLNEVDETGLASSGREKALEWKSYLEDHGVPASVRRKLGEDIDGACGQLRLREMEEEFDEQGN